MPLSKTQKTFLDYLIEKSVLREKQIPEIENILEDNANKNIREVLVKGGFVESEKLAQLEAERFNLPYINLSNAVFDETVMKELPQNLVDQHFIIGFAKDGKKLKLALANLDDYNAREAIDFWAESKGYQIEYYVCSYSAWENFRRKFNDFSQDLETAVSQAEEKREELQGDISTENIEEVVKSAPVAQIVSMVIKHAIESNASDIHIEPYKTVSRVRYRVDGVLQTVLTLPKSIHDAIISRIKVLAQLKIDETRIPQDGRLKFIVNSKEYDLRVSVMPLDNVEKVTMRILDTNSQALTLNQLGFSQDIQKFMLEALKQTFGMILVTGPTGSGKSTTLFALLAMINKEGINICTLEDPIEYFMPGVNQAQIRPEVNFTFASGLRALLRQDPDVIMVGEIRDNETAEMSVHAALTGHLLFSTLHTNDSIGAIPRLVDMKVEPFLIASTVNLIIAQRLARRVCSKCKEEYILPEEMQQKIKKELGKIKPEKLPADIDLSGQLKGYRGKGCTACKNTGYSGRVVLAEPFPITEKMRSIIADGFKIKEVKEELAKSNIINLLQDGLIKSLQGITTLEEVFRVSKEVDEQE